MTAVRQVALRVRPEASLIPVNVQSGISSMPVSDAETLLGAENRACNALQQATADLGVGLEGVVNRGPAKMMMIMGWVVILDRASHKGIGGTSRMPLPEAIAKRILDGEELGLVVDNILQEENVRQKGGGVDALTHRLILRGEALAMTIAYALSPFIAPELHDLAHLC